MPSPRILARISALSLLAFLPPALGAQPPSTDPEIAELRRQLAELTHRLTELETSQAQTAQTAAQAARATDDTPKVTLDRKGLTVASADQNYSLTLDGLIQLDGRFYFDDPQDTDTFLVRRLRPSLRGTLYRDFDFRGQVEFAGSSVSVLDAWARYTYSPALRLKVGKMKTPVGLERLQSPADLFLAERGLASNLTPTRDIGAMVEGKAFDRVLEYQLGVFNGAGNNQNPNADFNSPKTVSVRFYLTPFAAATDSALAGLSFGLAGSYGDEAGQATPTQKTPGQETFFQYASGTTATGEHTRLNPQISYFYGPFGLIAEAIYDRQAFSRGGVEQTVDSWGWTIAPSYVLTGGKNTYKGVVLDKGAGLNEGGIGAWMVSARYAGMLIGEGAYAGVAASQLANPANTARTAQDFGLSVNWYPVPNLKVMLDYDHTTFSDGGYGPTEHALVTRVQVAF